MKKIKLIYLLLAAGILSSCSAIISNNSFKKIQPGMTQEEVVSLCKEPVFKRFDELGEEWEYRAVVSGYSSIVIINFEEGRVLSLDMFKEPANPVIALPPTPSTPIVESRPPHPPYERPTQRPNYNKPSSHHALSDKEFSNFYDSVRRGFSSDRIKKIRTVNLTSAQCLKLLQIFTFKDEKIEAIIEMYPQVVDRQNYYKVIDTLPFTSEKEQVRNAIKRYK